MFCQYLGLNLFSCKKRERKNTQEGWTTEHLTRPIRTRVFQIQLNNSCWTVITDVIIEQLSEEQAAYRRNDRIVAGEIWQMSKCFSTLEFFLSLRSLFNQLFIAMGFDRVVSTTWLCLIVETLHDHTDYEYVAIAVKFDDIASTSYTRTPEVVIIFNYDRFYGMWRLITLRTIFFGRKYRRCFIGLRFI